MKRLLNPLRLQEADRLPFNRPGRKAATNRYVHTMLNMLDEEKREQTLRKVIDGILHRSSRIERKGFEQQLEDPDGFISGPAYALFRQEVMNAYTQEANFFFEDFNLLLLQNQSDLLIFGGNILGYDNLFKQIHEVTPNFTDALELLPVEEVDLPTTLDPKIIQKKFGKNYTVRRWQWRVLPHYVDDLSSFFPQQTVQQILELDAWQTVAMYRSLPKAFLMGFKDPPFGKLLSENIEEVSSRAASLKEELPYYCTDIILPGSPGMKVQRLLMPFTLPIQHLRMDRHIQRLAHRVSERQNNIKEIIDKLHEFTRRHQATADRLEQVVEHWDTFTPQHLSTLKKLAARSPRPVLLNINKSLSNLPVSQSENSLFPSFSPKSYVEKQRYMVHYLRAYDDAFDKLTELEHRLRENESEFLKYHHHLLSTIAFGIRSSRHIHQFDIPLNVIQKIDGYTYEHTRRVRLGVTYMARELKRERSGLSIEEYQEGALLHDIGKIGLYIGSTNEQFTLEQRKEMERHPVFGHTIASLAGRSYIVEEMTLYHHERPDGTGYPQGLKGDAIPLSARTLSVIDAYDAIRSREYRAGRRRSIDEAMQEIDAVSGSQLDPVLVQLFKKICFETDFVKVYERALRDPSTLPLLSSSPP